MMQTGKFKVLNLSGKYKFCAMSYQAKANFAVLEKLELKLLKN